MRRVRLLHIFYSFNVYNGMIEMFNIMAEFMDHTQFELAVCVFRYDGNEYGEKFERLGGRIYSLDIPPGWFQMPREITKLYRFVKAYRPDIVQTYVLKPNLYGTQVARWARVPVIIPTEVTLRDIAPAGFRRMRHRMVQPLVKRALRLSDRFMVISDFIGRDWYGDQFRNKLEVIYPPFSLEKFETAQAGETDYTFPSGSRIGYVGRLSGEKDVANLIQSMVTVLVRIPEAHLVLVGTGQRQQELMTLAKDLGVEKSVVFVGFWRNPFEMLRQFDLFVLPSRTEGCPLAVVEAMAMGRPVVATHVGGIPELVVDGETGILVPPNDVPALADAIVRILSNGSLAAKMGALGRKRAFDHFHPTIFISKLQTLYMQLIEIKGLADEKQPGRSGAPRQASPDVRKRE